jgi:hypothetical protein
MRLCWTARHQQRSFVRHKIKSCKYAPGLISNLCKVSACHAHQFECTRARVWVIITITANGRNKNRYALLPVMQCSDGQRKLVHPWQSVSTHSSGSLLLRPVIQLRRILYLQELKSLIAHRVANFFCARQWLFCELRVHNAHNANHHVYMRHQRESKKNFPHANI